MERTCTYRAIKLKEAAKHEWPALAANVLRYGALLKGSLSGGRKRCYRIASRPPNAAPPPGPPVVAAPVQHDGLLPVVDEVPLQGPFAFSPGLARVAGSLPVPVPMPVVPGVVVLPFGDENPEVLPLTGYSLSFRQN